MIKFYQEDYQEFKNWIQISLDLDPHHKNDVVYFLDRFFIDGLDASQIWDRFNRVLKIAYYGPLHTWLKTLAHRWICYLFVVKNHGLNDHPSFQYLSRKDLMSVLRDFLVEKFPDKENILSDLFLNQTSFFLQKKVFFKELCQEFGLPAQVQGTAEEEWLLSIEIYWTGQWKKLLKYVDQEQQKYFLEDKGHKIVNKDYILSLLNFLKETFILLMIVTTLVFFIKNINQWIEHKLEHKIKLFEPSYLWDTKIFTSKTSVDKATAIKEDLLEISKVSSLKEIETQQEKEERFEEESDFFDLEQMPVEELNASVMKGAKEQTFSYRDDRYGGNKIYRLMLRGDDTVFLKTKIQNLIHFFGAKQVGHFSSNVNVAGGTYYSLFVGRHLIEQFIRSTENLTHSSLFITKTSKFTPPGHVRVFIWLKHI
jgi:hypothetical protein